MKIKKLTLLSCLTLALGAPGAAVAEKPGLYKVALPPGNAGIRIFNAGPALTSGSARFGERRLGALGTGEASLYYTMVAGSRQVSCGDRAIMTNIQEAKFYTFVCGGPYEGSLLEDPQPTNANKTFVILYNLTQKDNIKLMTSNGKLSVVDSTAQKTMGGREINPVRVEFGIFDKQNQRLFDIGQVALSPEKVYSIFATQVAGEVRAYVRESFLASEM
ncbi:MAG TPA: alginate O-acetyltransferase AlgF [Moraxellaceae bacterium]|nr:alginate O-acetyltransferase AlgF [Moraxellaceae bacterium]